MDVFVDELLDFLEGRVFEMMQIFFFEMVEEILYRRIAPAVAAARYGGRNVILRRKNMICPRSVLRPLAAGFHAGRLARWQEFSHLECDR